MDREPIRVISVGYGSHGRGFVAHAQDGSFPFDRYPVEIIGIVDPSRAALERAPSGIATCHDISQLERALLERADVIMDAGPALHGYERLRALQEVQRRHGVEPLPVVLQSGESQRLAPQHWAETDPGGDVGVREAIDMVGFEAMGVYGGNVLRTPSCSAMLTLRPIYALLDAGLPEVVKVNAVHTKIWPHAKHDADYRRGAVDVEALLGDRAPGRIRITNNYLKGEAGEPGEYTYVCQTTLRFAEDLEARGIGMDQVIAALEAGRNIVVDGPDFDYSTAQRTPDQHIGAIDIDGNEITYSHWAYLPELDMPMNHLSAVRLVRGPQAMQELLTLYRRGE